MGLDMYLTKETYIGASFEHRKVNGTVEITVGDKKVAVDLKKIRTIVEDAGYWRKANQIHAWFVKNVQDGSDECEKHYVSFEQLTELKNLCLKVLDTRDASLLPPQSGFFFGSTDVNEYYFADLEDTVKIIEALDPEGEYYYQSSW